MIGRLPEALEVNGSEWSIRTDFRDILVIMQASADPDLDDYEKAVVTLKILYIDFDDMCENDYAEALKQAGWFLDCGQEERDRKVPRVMDWEQDEGLIFPAINKVAGQEVRAVDYMHWWTFCGYFMEINEGVFSSVLNIRQKKAKGKKLEKWEQDFYRDNKDLCDLRKKYSAEEQNEIDYWNKRLG